MRKIIKNRIIPGVLSFLVSSFVFIIKAQTDAQVAGQEILISPDVEYCKAIDYKN